MGVLSKPSALDALYGLLLAGGGVMGYAKAQSVPSLVAGVGSGLIVSLSGYTWLKSLWSLVLTGVMGRRFQASGKFMPAGLVSVIAALMCVVNAAKALRGKKGKKAMAAAAPKPVIKAKPPPAPSPKQIQTMHKIAIVVSSVEKSVEYYTKILGLEVLERFANADDEDYVFLRAGNVVLELMPQKSMACDTGIHHLSFKVSDTDRAFKAIQLANAGDAGPITTLAEPFDIPGEQFRGLRLAFFADPDSTRLQLFARDGWPGLPPRATKPADPNQSIAIGGELVSNLAKVRVVVSDVEKSVHFYSKMLGLSVSERFRNQTRQIYEGEEDIVQLRSPVGGLILELAPQKSTPGSPPLGFDHLAFKVESVGLARAGLESELDQTLQLPETVELTRREWAPRPVRYTALRAYTSPSALCSLSLSLLSLSLSLCLLFLTLCVAMAQVRAHVLPRQGWEPAGKLTTAMLSDPDQIKLQLCVCAAGCLQFLAKGL
eukprot:COSAG05_NODE_305_length_11703_cov_15.056705_2_plen_488_part_00